MSYVDFTPYLNSFMQFYHELLAFKADLSNLLCFGDSVTTSSTGAKWVKGSSHVQKSFCIEVMKNTSLWMQSKDPVWGTQIRSTILGLKYYSVYKHFLGTIDHLDYHLSIDNMGNSMFTQSDTLCQKHSTHKQPYIPKEQCSDLPLIKNNS